jgi:beta-carotene 3-hydroxylase
MRILLYIAVFIFAFFLMEGIAWSSHKYIMHGFLWKLHKDHHSGNKGKLEHNDWFSLIFACPSAFLIYTGLKYSYDFAAIIGFAMAAYGSVYFLVHDVFIHQRIKLFRNADSIYLRALRRAHKIHHRNTGKDQAESFGFLIVQKKYFRQPASNSLFDK